MSRRERLEALFGTGPVSSLLPHVDARIAALGLHEPMPVDDEDDDEDPRELLWWLLRMAAHTHAREAFVADEDPATLAAFEALVESRPEADEEQAQMMIDARSSLARARAIRSHTTGSVLAVGDDDATVLALALLDSSSSTARLAVADIDPAVLAFLVASAKSIGATVDARRADVFEDTPDAEWEGRFDAAVTDPVRSFDACVAFVTYARRAVRSGGLVFLADHPDWNLELDEVLAHAADELGLRLVRTLPLVHAYPVDATWVPDPEAKAAELAERGVNVDPAWLRTLVDDVCGCTNLYVLQAD